MSLSHTTEYDDTQTHQVRLTASSNQVWVSCTCRRTTGKNEKAGKLSFDHIGPTKNIEESRRLYNDPANHWAPFNPETDKALW